MRDVYQPLVWSDLTTVVAPGLITLALGISALMHPMRPVALAAVLGMHLVIMAAAAGAPASWAARRLRVWGGRGAPSTAQAHVAAQWQRRAAWLLALGGVGPLLMAGRLLLDGEPGQAIWTAVVPGLGWALGSFVGWAWQGFAGRAWLGVGTVLSVVPALFSFSGSTWIPNAAFALTAAAPVLLLMWMAWRQSSLLQPQWDGLRLVARPSRQGVGPRLRPARWAMLAWDSSSPDEPQSGWHLLSAQFNLGVGFALLGPTWLAFLASGSVLDGWRAVGLGGWAVWLCTVVCGGLVYREQHWRLRLAPGGMSPAGQAMSLLAGSTAMWLAALGVYLVLLIFRLDGERGAGIGSVSATLIADFLFAVAFVAALRGLRNRGPVLFFGVLALSLALGSLAGICAALGAPLVRGPGWLGVEGLLTVVLYVWAARLWRVRAMWPHPVKSKARQVAC